MKRIKKMLRRGAAPAPAQAGRITNETVAEHREQILAGGRKFKYPVQYSRHKLVINSVAIGAVTVLLLAVVIWQQLYPAQNTSKLAYRVTQLLPLPVASVDGEMARYSTYLLKYRSSMHFLQQQNDTSLTSADSKRQIDFVKRRELDNVLFDAYVTKTARATNTTVSDKEADAFIASELSSKNVSLDAYETTVLRKYYDWSLDEYRSVVKAELLKRKVAFEVDNAANSKAVAIKKQLDTGADFTAVAKAESDDANTKANGGVAGTVPLKNQDPNGLIAAASKLPAGGVSQILHGTDGYYIVKQIEKNETTIQYQVIKVALNELKSRYDAAQKAGKIHEYLTIAK